MDDSDKDPNENEIRATPLLFPATGPATGSFNGLHAKSKFLAASQNKQNKQNKTMNLLKKITLPIAVIAIGWALFSASTAEAAHFRYGTLNWETTASPGEVKFNLTAAYRRSNFSFGTGPGGWAVTGDIITPPGGPPPSINFGDGTFTPNLKFEVIAHSIIEDWVIGVALDPVTGEYGVRRTYTTSGPFTAFMAACCRIPLNNRSGGPYRLETVVDLSNPNRSPVTTMVPTVFMIKSSTATFFVPAADPDGDALRWRLSTAAEAGGGTQPPGMSIDPNTGMVTWNNLGLNQTNFWTAQVVIEDLDAAGNVKSKTPVDFLLRIIDAVGEPPKCTIDPAGPLTVIAGTPVSVTVTADDPDGDTVTLNSAGLPGGATMTPALPADGVGTVSSTFNWTPTVAQAGSQLVLFSATDGTGQQSLCSIAITVLEPPQIEADVAKYFTDSSSVELLQDEDGNDVVTVVLRPNRQAGTTTVSSTNPGQIIGWVTVTNTGVVPIGSLLLEDFIPNDWSVHPVWGPSRGAIHLFYDDGVDVTEVTDPDLISADPDNPPEVVLEIADMAALLGKDLDPGERLLLGIKMQYALRGTDQDKATYPRTSENDAIVTIWEEADFSGASSTHSGQAAFEEVVK